MHVDQRPQDFVQKSNLRGFLVLFLDWAALFGIVTLSIWINHWLVYLASVWIIGSLQFSIGESLFHEASHYNLFKTKKLNNFFEFAYALPFFVDITQYRYDHEGHHYHMNTNRDHIVEDYQIHGLNKPEKNMFWLWIIKPIIGYAGLFYLRFVIQLNPRKSATKFFTFWVIVVCLFWYFDLLHILLLYWFVPFLWSFSCFYYWSEVGEHFNTKTGTRSDVGFLKNFFHHNSGYHYIHHKYPTIPWYNLPKAHKSLCPEGTDITHSFFETYKQLKEKKSF